MIYPPAKCSKFGGSKKVNETCKDWEKPAGNSSPYFIKFMGRMVCGGCGHWETNQIMKVKTSNHSYPEIC